jgi:hypothetical protein
MDIALIKSNNFGKRKALYIDERTSSNSSFSVSLHGSEDNSRNSDLNKSSPPPEIETTEQNKKLCIIQEASNASSVAMSDVSQPELEVEVVVAVGRQRKVKGVTYDLYTGNRKSPNGSLICFYYGPLNKRMHVYLCKAGDGKCGKIARHGGGTCNKHAS